MKILTKITIGLATATLLLVGCNETAQVKPQSKAQAKPILDESQLCYRGTTNLLKEDVIPPSVQYHSAAPGAAKKIKRAFQDAPPMIPHSTEGLLPVTKNNNACLGCHMPENAKAMGMGATPIPISHFTNFRPNTTVEGNELLKKGQVVKNTSSETLANVSIKVDEKENKLYPGRYNCTQCHAPQATNTLVDQNGFKPVYTAPDGSSKSSWNQSKWLKDINTQKTSK